VSDQKAPFVNDEPLFRPLTGPDDPKLGPGAVIVSVGPDVEPLAAALDLKKKPFRHLMLSRLFLSSKKGGPVSLAGPTVGSPHTTMVLEQLCAYGAREIIFMGWCGSLNEDLPVGALLVPEKAVIDEGVSCHYPLPGKGREQFSLPDEELSLSLALAAGQGKSPVFRGPVWTTDAPFRETPSKIAAFAAKGAVAVDMETSALFTVARFLNVRLAALCVVSDTLHGGKWNPGFFSQEFRQGRSDAKEALCLTSRRWKKSRPA
jgi:purine-nucleoside phosphorylase